MSKRLVITYPLDDAISFKKKLLTWAQNFDTIAWLDSNLHQEEYGQLEAILAVGESEVFRSSYAKAFDKLNAFQQSSNDYLFGYLGYDLKNDIEDLHSSNFDGLCFDDVYFFKPKKLIEIRKSSVAFRYLKTYTEDIATDFRAILEVKITTKQESYRIDLQKRISKKHYFESVQNILNHIKRGDCYEVNFCQEYFATDAQINLLQVFNTLNELSSAPFASFLKIEGRYLLSASPERFLQKNGHTVLSQPIKGTARRSENPLEDKKIKQDLENDTKERAENIMIVDLVRNDLSKIALKASVKVDELCKAYTFKQVHQLISTVSCQVNSDAKPVDFLKQLFPMGSMTGAPKLAAMQLIEKYERGKRGLYSGAVGYFTPQGDFDFNVVIRSILYNAITKYASFSVGGAITAKSEVAKEYAECELKAQALKKALGFVKISKVS